MAQPIAVYISGPIAGVPDCNWKAFNEAARLLSSKGFSVVNPLEVNPPEFPLPREVCLRNDLIAMTTLYSIEEVRPVDVPPFVEQE